MQATHCGTLAVEFEETGAVTPCSHVLVIPGLASSMISLGSLTKKQVRANFIGNECHLSRDGIPIGIAFRTREDVYRLRALVLAAAGVGTCLSVEH